MDRLFNSVGMVNASNNSQLHAALETTRKNGRKICVGLLGESSDVSGQIEEIHLDEGWFMVKEPIASSYNYVIVNMATVAYMRIY